MKIVPIILASSNEEFSAQANKIGSLSNHINIDVCDGIVAPSPTLSLEEILTKINNNPLLVSKKIDFDLMVKDWLPLVELLNHNKDLNINSVVVHQKYLQKNPTSEFDFGVALDLADKVVYKTLSKFPLIQIMTVELGKQGGTFHPEALLKVTELRQNGYEGQIVIDGGVSDLTLPLILENKGLPDIVGVGSYLTRSFNSVENYQKLQSIVTNYSY